MPIGKVKWYDADFGVGAIAPDDGTKQAFFHILTVKEAGLTDLQAGQSLRYETRKDPGKLTAIKLEAV